MINRSALGAPLADGKFDTFLFSPIGEGKNGETVSVLSAFARLALDPWKEAERLAKMSAEAATTELLSLIEAQPTGSLLCPEPKIMAYRLIGLLPRKKTTRVLPENSAEKQASAPQLPRIPSTILWLSFCVLLIFTLVIIMNPQYPSQNDTGEAAELNETVTPNTPSGIHP